MVRVALSLLFLAVITVGKKRLKIEEDFEDGDDVRGAIPGEPGRDYPTLAAVPATSFTCGSEGFFADPETRCQVFHICALQGGVMGRQSFLCPNGTVFNAHVNTCDWWNKVHCAGLGLSIEAVDDSRLYSETKPPRQQASKLKNADRAKLTSRRRKPSENKIEPFSEASDGNFNALQSHPSPGLRNRGSVQVLNGENDQYLGDYNRQLSSNSISTEGFQQSTTENVRQILGMKGYPTTLSDIGRVAEVTIKPRVRYTHSLRANSDTPLYSLNPLIHLARDSSLLSTFTTFSDVSPKVNPPVERYVVNDVLPQYNYSREVSLVNIGPKTPIIQPGSSDSDQINLPDDGTDPLFPPENSDPLLDDLVNNFGLNFESSGTPQGGVDETYNTDEPILTLVKPDESSSNETDANKNNIFLQVGSNFLSPSSNKTSNGNYPAVVRVTSGYMFTPTDDNGYGTPKTVKVTTKYSVGEDFPTESPEINNQTINPLRDVVSPERPSVLQNEEPLRNPDISSDGLVISTNRPQNVPSFNSIPFGNSWYNYNAPDTSNDTNAGFIDRFIVNEDSPQLTNTNSYNPNSFDTQTYTAANYIPQPVSNSYPPSPSSSEDDSVTQPTSNATSSSPSSSGNYVNTVFNTTPQPYGVSYNNIPGHYITREPQEISSNSFNPDYNQKYELNIGAIPFTQPNQQIQKSFLSLVTDQNTKENQESLRNFYSTTQNPEAVVTSRENLIVLEPQIPNTLNPLEQHLYNRYGPTIEYPAVYGVPTSSYDSSGFGELISQKHGSVSNKIPHQYQPYHQTFSLEVPQYYNHPPPQFQFPLPENNNVVSTDQSKEIVDKKEKENIFSKLKIDNVLPSVEAYSWSTVITPPTMTEGSLQSQTNSSYSATTPVPPSSGNYNNQNSFREATRENLTPSTETGPRASTVSLSNTPSKTLFSTDTDSSRNPHEDYSFSTTDKTTAKFVNSNGEVNLYTALNIGNISPSVEQYTSLNNVYRPTASSKTSSSQRFQNDFTTERNLFQQSTPFHRNFVTTTASPGLINGKQDYQSLPSLPFSTPKPFSESHGLFVAPQRHSTILPDYKEEGKQLLNPADLLQINSLRSLAGLKKSGDEEPAELIKSISFSFDNAEDIEQFQIAKSKGWFSL